MHPLDREYNVAPPRTCTRSTIFTRKAPRPSSVGYYASWLVSHFHFASTIPGDDPFCPEGFSLLRCERDADEAGFIR